LNRKPHQIISVAPIVGDDAEWEYFAAYLTRPYRCGRPLVVELNVSCPNTEHEPPPIPSAGQLRRLLEQDNLTVIFKLQPLPGSVDIAARLVDVGARYLHLSNTLPSPVGGISGAPLREVTLPLVERVALLLSPNIEIIAGGGIYAPEHVRAYRDAGATRFSLATAWFWPPRALRVMRSM
jgi:dihydroorotate dehydrogenase